MFSVYLKKTKTAEEVLQAHVDNVYLRFGGSMKIWSGNGTEFKNKIFEKVAKELCISCIPPLTTQHLMAGEKDSMPS